ncbi:MAG: type II toxin-antitoxin system RelE/ParE family toxin [Bacteroidia bacterium]
MSYKIEVTSYFKKQAKHLLKKYPSLKNELAELINRLEVNPEQGIAIGSNCYKIRIAIASKGKGKSGGARVITHVQVIKQHIFLLSIYDKAEQPNIVDKELQALLKLIP